LSAEARDVAYDAGLLPGNGWAAAEGMLVGDVPEGPGGREENCADEGDVPGLPAASGSDCCEGDRREQHAA